MHIKLLFFKVCSNVRYINRYVTVFRRYYPPFKQSGSDQESQPISFWIFIVPPLKNILFVIINIDVNSLLSFQVYVMILLMPSVLSVSLSWSWQKALWIRVQGWRSDWGVREMQAKWLDFMANSRGSNSGKALCIEFLGLTIPLPTGSYNTLQYLSQLEVTIPLSTSSYNTLQYSLNWKLEQYLSQLSSTEPKFSFVIGSRRNA